MYIHLGQNVMLPHRRVIGIFDLDITSQSKRTQQYLRGAEEEGVVIPCGEELPKSFVVCDHPYHRQIVYMSMLNSQTIQKRVQSEESFRRNEHE